MKQNHEDRFWQEMFSGLKKHPPRPGFEKRFWAQVDGLPALQPIWKWLPIGAVMAGLILGLGLGQYRAKQSADTASGPVLRTQVPAIGAVGNLPEGSLTATFTFKEGE